MATPTFQLKTHNVFVQVDVRSLTVTGGQISFMLIRILSGPSPDASPSSPPAVPRPRASPSRTAASSPGGDARSRTGGRGGGGNGGIAGIGGTGENMLRGVELRWR